jgi:hypothetical protein
MPPRDEEQTDRSQSQGGRQGMQAERQKWLVFGDFQTMDTEPARIALDPKRLAWAENVVIVANNDLRAVPGVGSTLATLTGETITARFYAYFNAKDYLVYFCNSGAAYTVEVNNGTKVNFAAAGTFTATPDLTQWQDQRILIADSQAGYCTYDGTLFIKEGNVSPNFVIQQGGVGYASAPTVSINGGTGSGATATAVLTDDTVTSITLTNAGTGYIFSDILTVSFTGGTPTGGGVLAITVLHGGYGYLHVPTLAIAAPAGGGTTALATAVVSLGRIVGVTVTNAGSGYKETPAITITPTGGDTPSRAAILTPVMDTTASATVVIWPFTIKPTTLDVFQGRVWMSAGRELAYTGLTGYDDVDSANAAGSQILSDSDVVHYITKLKSANNFLFIICDQSVKQIGTISVNGTTTQFNITSLFSDQGTIYPASVRSYDRTVVLTNQVGVYGIFGASVVKLSGPMTGIIEKADFSLPPVSDVFDFYGEHTLLTLVRYLDPDEGARSLIMAFYNKRWTVISAGDTITGIVSAHLAGREKIFSDDGATIKEIIADTSVEVDVLIRTALAHNGEPQINKRLMRMLIGQSSSEPNTVNVTVDSENGSRAFSFQAGQTIQFVNSLNQAINFTNALGDIISWLVGGYISYETALSDQSGLYLGASVHGSFKGYHFNNLILQYEHGPLMKSRNAA